MDLFPLVDVLALEGGPYREFLRVPDLSVGLYVLGTGAVDGQSPHTEDEVYVVMAGRGVIHVAGDDRPVKPGSVVYVGAGVVHRFHSVAEDLHVLVFWAPPYGSRARPPAAGTGS